MEPALQGISAYEELIGSNPSQEIEACLDGTVHHALPSRVQVLRLHWEGSKGPQLWFSGSGDAD